RECSARAGASQANANNPSRRAGNKGAVARSGGFASKHSDRDAGESKLARASAIGSACECPVLRSEQELTRRNQGDRAGYSDDPFRRSHFDELTSTIHALGWECRDRRRNAPRPARPRNLSPSTTTSPRERTASGTPVTSIPSNIE